MADKLMYIPNNDNQNYPFCRLQLKVKTLEINNHLTGLTNQNSTKVTKVVRPTNKKNFED